MKTLKLILPALILISLLITGCSNQSPVTNSGGPNNTDTTFEAYIIITPSSGTPDTLYFTDRNLCTGSYSSSQNNTYCILNDTTTSQSISVSFTGNTTGAPPFTFGYLSYMSGGYSGNGITGNVSLYESPNGKIKGTYSGSFSDGSTSYLVRAVFTVIRTQ